MKKRLYSLAMYALIGGLNVLFFAQVASLYADADVCLPFAISDGKLFNDDREFPLVSTLPKVGALAPIGNGVSDGIFLCFNKVNITGGIDKKTIEFSILDDGGNVLKAVSNVIELKKKSPLFFAPTGDAVFENAVRPEVTAGKAVALFPVSGAWHDKIRRDECNKIIFFRPSYAQEIAALIHHAVTSLRKKKIALFYEDADWTKGVVSIVTNELKKYTDATLVSSEVYPSGTVDVKPAVMKIKQGNPEVVLCIASGRAAYSAIVVAVNDAKMYNTTFMGVSHLSAIQEQLKRWRGTELITSSVVPNPWRDTAPIVVEYREMMREKLGNRGLSTSSLEGYIIASILVESVKRIGGNPSIKDLFDYIIRYKKASISGVNLSYDGRSLSQDVWINTGEKSTWPKYTIKSSR